MYFTYWNNRDAARSEHPKHLAEIIFDNAHVRNMLKDVHVPVIGAHGTTGDLSEVMLRRAKEIAKHAVLAITRQFMRMGFRGLPWKIDQYRVFSFVRLDGALRQCGFKSVELRILPWSGGHAYIFARR